MTGDEAGSELVTVRLVDLPVALHQRASEHSEGLQREFRLIADHAGREPAHFVPGRLLDLVQTLRGSYGRFTVEQEDAFEAAVAQGQATMTLTFRVPRDAAGAARRLGALLDEADDFCREGRLLTLATPPDLVAYRRWYLAQFVEQIGGVEPAPWQPQDGAGRG